MRVSVGELPDLYPVLASLSSQREACLHVHHAEVPLWLCAALGSRNWSPFECNSKLPWRKLVFVDILLLLPFPRLLSEAPWLSSFLLASSLKGRRSVSWGLFKVHRRRKYQAVDQRKSLLFLLPQMLRRMLVITRWKQELGEDCWKTAGINVPV